MSVTWIVRRSSTARPAAVPPPGEMRRQAWRGSGLRERRDGARRHRPGDRGVEGVAQTGSAPQHRREHGLDVGRRAGDDAQDLGGRGLLLVCLRQLRVRACWSSAVAVAACCSSALLSARVTSAYDGAGGPLGLAVRGVPHAPQNFCPLGFSCWHRGQRIRSGSRFRVVRGQPGTASRHPGSHRSSASRPSRGARAPRPYRDPASGARWAVLGRGSPWSLWGDPVGGSDESELTCTPCS